MPKGLLFRYGKALDRIAELEADRASLQYSLDRAFQDLEKAEAEVERLREVHDTGYCREHDSYLGTDGPLGCLVPFAGKGRSA